LRKSTFLDRFAGVRFRQRSARNLPVIDALMSLWLAASPLITTLPAGVSTRKDMAGHVRGPDCADLHVSRRLVIAFPQPTHSETSNKRTKNAIAEDDPFFAP
jgi:hypothetical protein